MKNNGITIEDLETMNKKAERIFSHPEEYSSVQMIEMINELENLFTAYELNRGTIWLKTKW